MDSLPSDTLSTIIGEGEADIDLEDLTYSLMEKTGFMSYIKSQILQFIEANGNLSAQDDITVNPERINPTLLSNVYEYLKWIGLDNTCTHLLAEAPIQICTDATTDTEPTLLKMFTAKTNDSIARSPMPLTVAVRNINELSNVDRGFSGYEVPISKEQGKSLKEEVENLSKVGQPSLTSISSEENEKTEDVTFNSNAEDYTNVNIIKLPVSETSNPVTANATSIISNSMETNQRQTEICAAATLADAIEKKLDDVPDASSEVGNSLNLNSKATVEGEDDGSSIMSSIKEDSELISELSVYQTTEDISVPSNVNSISSAEYHLNLGKP